VFHVELRRFPHVARAFNLSAEQLDARIVAPLVHGRSVELDERRFAADKTRVKIYEGPAIAAEDRGLGRGWSLVTRDGEDVTTKLLDAARQRHHESSREGILPGLKQELVAAARGRDGVNLAAVVTLAAGTQAGRRSSEALALAEQAVWELLHEGTVTLVREDEEVPREEWESVLLLWEAWAASGSDVRLRAYATTSAISRSRSASDANR
jgi:hypothetical protein